MSTNFKQLKKVDESTKNLIYGFCRKSHESLPTDNIYYNIQPLIIHIIMLYYWIKYEWCTDEDYLQSSCFDIKQDVVTRIYDSGNRTIFLDQTISSGIHEYKFRIFIAERDQNYFDLSIGIIMDKFIKPENIKNECHFLQDTGYGFSTSRAIASCKSNWLSREYAKIPNDGDIITMIVDLEQNTISYKINDEDYGVAFDQIEEGEYRVAVYSYTIGSKIELL